MLLFFLLNYFICMILCIFVGTETPIVQILIYFLLFKKYTYILPFLSFVNFCSIVDASLLLESVFLFFCFFLFHFWLLHLIILSFILSLCVYHQ